MSHDPAGFYSSHGTEMAAAKALAPDLGKAFAPFFQTLMKDGALSVKHKELIALGIAVATHCEPCIYAHVEKCFKHGATAAEIMEAAGVGVVMGGGPAYIYTPVVAAAVKHWESAKTAG
ncbi:MAG: carboxymuconolactone decarboxylase family protein [Phycisphaerales bacterium]